MTQRPPDPIPFPGPGRAPQPQQPPQQQPAAPVIYSASGQPIRSAPPPAPDPAPAPADPIPLNRADAPPAPEDPDEQRGQGGLHEHIAAVIDSTDETFERDVLQRSQEIPVIVDCWAPWCGPCRVLGPILERLAYERDGQIQLVKVNTDENPQIARALQVQSIPAVFAFIQGRLVNQFVGALPEDQVVKFVDSLIPSEADRKAAEGYRMMQQDQIPIARLHFEAALEENPEHEAAGIGLAALLMGLGELDRAVELARRFPDNPASKSILGSLELRNAIGERDPDAIRAAAAAAPDDAEARFRHGCLLALEGQMERALEELLESVRLDRYACDEGARRRLLDLFNMLGEHPAVSEYRRRLGSLLF